MCFLCMHEMLACLRQRERVVQATVNLDSERGGYGKPTLRAGGSAFLINPFKLRDEVHTLRINSQLISVAREAAWVNMWEIITFIIKSARYIFTLQPC